MFHNQSYADCDAAALHADGLASIAVPLRTSATAAENADLK
jgi:hypothetical protein